jgi:hypothetical protein
MISKIIIISKRQPQYTCVVRAEDWLNPDKDCIEVQEAYTGESIVIYKCMYKVGWVIDGKGKPNFSF